LYNRVIYIDEELWDVIDMEPQFQLMLMEFL